MMATHHDHEQQRSPTTDDEEDGRVRVFHATPQPQPLQEEAEGGEQTTGDNTLYSTRSMTSPTIDTRTPIKTASASPLSPEEEEEEGSPAAATPPTDRDNRDTSTGTGTSTPYSFLHYYLEGIPVQALQQHQQQQQQHQQEDPRCWLLDDASFDSLLSSLESDEELSFIEEEQEEDEDGSTTTSSATNTSNGFYYTPMEERPNGRVEQVKRDLQWRWEFLEHFTKKTKQQRQQQGDVPAAEIERLWAQERRVQQLKLNAAVYREEERHRRKAERQRQRRRCRQLLEEEQQTQEQREGATKELYSTEENDTKEMTTPLKSTTNSTKHYTYNSHASHGHQATTPSLSSSSSPSTPSTTGSNTSTPEKVSPKLLFGKSPNQKISSSSFNSSNNNDDDDESQTINTTTNTYNSTHHHNHWTNTTSTYSRLMEWLSFERYNAVPALICLLLSCLAHAALYELCLTIVMTLVIQPFVQYRVLTDSEDRILEQSVHNLHVEDGCYWLVFVVAVFIARISGLLYSYMGDEYAPEPGQPNRIDQKWSYWLHYTKRGRRVKGFLDVTAFYLSFVATMYFLNRFAVLVDQRDELVQHMPSNNNYNILVDNNNHHRHHPLNSANEGHIASTMMTEQQGSTFIDGFCPAHWKDILLPMDRENDTIIWDISDCIIIAENDNDDEENEREDESNDEDDNNGVAALQDHFIYECGQEDEAYLYDKLSASAYHQFWGYGYRAALFDLPHLLLFNAALSVMAIYTLKKYFGCSFWEYW